MEELSKEFEKQRGLWPVMQVGTLAVVCLVVGLAAGYLLRGSAPGKSPDAVQAAAPQAMPPSGMSGGMPQTMPSMQDMKRMGDKKAEPLLAKLKSDPNNAKLLNQVGILYRSTHQFKEAEEYFQKSLEVDPKNVDVRTDLAACMYYSGDVDAAIAELEKGLTYDPKHPGALMNLGIIRWKGKNDAPGAIASWEKLLRLNPNFPQKAAVQHMITEAQQSGKIRG